MATVTEKPFKQSKNTPPETQDKILNDIFNELFNFTVCLDRESMHTLTDFR